MSRFGHFDGIEIGENQGHVSPPIFLTPPFDIEFLCDEAIFSAMAKPETRSALVRTQRCRRPFSRVGCSFEPEWTDAEARAFLERPIRFRSVIKLLRAILLTAMAVSLANIAWILATYA